MAFIVDTGIMANHTEFEGRAVQAFNAVNDVDTDENGHGSHVAGTIGGVTFGVAKKVTLVGVKVLDAQGAGTNSRVLAGMNFGTCLFPSLLSTIVHVFPRRQYVANTQPSRPDRPAARPSWQICHEHVAWR